MSNIPPKQTFSELPPEPHAGYENLPPQGLVLHDAAHGEANAFPVLKAFQDYLEMERQQARKRLVTLTVFFVSLMTLVVAGFIVAFIFLFNNMSKSQSHLIDLALQQGKEATTPAAPATALAQQAAKEFALAAQALQTNLGSQLASVGSTASRLDSKVDAQNAEMAKLRDTLTALQRENASMRADLPKLAADAARKAQPPAPVAQPPAPPPTRSATPPTPPPATTAGTPAASAGLAAPAGYEEAVLTVRSRDGAAIPWRAFLPK